MNIEKVKAVNAGRYDMSVGEMIELLNTADGNAANAMLLAFKYGFMRGQSAEKARAKKKAVQKSRKTRGFPKGPQICGSIQKAVKV